MAKKLTPAWESKQISHYSCISVEGGLPWFLARGWRLRMSLLVGRGEYWKSPGWEMLMKKPVQTTEVRGLARGDKDYLSWCPRKELTTWQRDNRTKEQVRWGRTNGAQTAETGQGAQKGPGRGKQPGQDMRHFSCLEALAREGDWEEDTQNRRGKGKMDVWKTVKELHAWTSQPWEPAQGWGPEGLTEELHPKVVFIFKGCLRSCTSPGTMQGQTKAKRQVRRGHFDLPVGEDVADEPQISCQPYWMNPVQTQRLPFPFLKYAISFLKCLWSPLTLISLSFSLPSIKSWE